MVIAGTDDVWFTYDIDWALKDVPLENFIINSHPYYGAAFQITGSVQ